MNLDLQSIGVPVIYRTMNPFSLSPSELLDAFPTLGNPDCVDYWMLQKGNTQSFAHVAWKAFLHNFTVECESHGQVPFLLDSERRNADEEVRTFLSVRRKMVRGYVDPIGVTTLPIFRTARKYTRNENSWWLRSQARIIKQIDGIAIGRDFQKRLGWLRTHCPEYRGSQSWHRWLQYGTVRVGWSTAQTESFFWYEIRCPHMPGVTGNYRNLDDAAFVKHVDSIWLPIVRNLRWWSSSNPRTWTL